MFYSQFILAKKGPLGTIWIAAHLERKLKKNQVADTDIGDSVDSILFPDVPIALRLSSHLLLGVVRIYSRKVNYLFHDCSEALLKVKQAFRSSAVDLPPEESTAPYHSITLPETFDLDDFELPDSALLNDNFDDRHVSSREQITLQDTLDGTGYSTSQFGLDERFGDGEASQFGLDLDEELLDTNLKLQHDPVSYDDPHKGEGGSDLAKMDIDETQPGGDEDRNNEASRELSELLCNDREKHVISDVQNMNRFDDASHRLAFNIQTPDLNEVFLPDNHNGGPSGAHSMDMDFSAADPPPPEFNQFANFPSTTIPANCQELPSSNPQENLPYTDIANGKLDKPVNKEVECPDATNKSLVNATVTNPELDNIVQAVSFPASILDESKSDSVAPQCSGGIFPSLYPVNDVHHIHNDSNDAAISGKLVSIESSDPQQSEVSRVLPSSTLVLPKAVPDSLVPPPVDNPGWVGFESTLRTTNNSHTGIVWNGANNLPGSVDKGTPYDSNDAATSGKLVSIESTDPKRSEVSRVLPSSTLVLPEAVPDSQVPPCSEGTVDNPEWVGFESTLRTTNNSHAGIVWNGANNLPGSVDNGTPYDSNAAATSGKLVSIESTDPKRSEVSRVLPSSTTNNSHAGIVWNGANNLPGSVDNGTPYYSNDAATSGKLVSIESTDPKRLEVSRVLPSSTLVQAVTDSQVPPCSDGTVDNPWRVGFESTLRTTNNSHAGIVWNGANNLPGFVDNGTPYDSNAAATSGKFVSIESTDPKRSEVSRVLPSSSSVLHEAVPDSLVPPCSDGTVDNPGWVGFESTLRTTNNAHAGIVWNGANNLPGSVDKGTPYADHTRQWNLDQCRVEEANFHQTNNFSALSSDFQMRSCTSVSNQANLGSAGDMLLEKTPGFSSRDQPCNLETPMVDLEMHISRSSLGLRGFSSGAIVSNIGSHLQLNDIRLGHPNCFSSSEFSEPERMLFAPSGNVNLSSDLGLQTIEKGVLEPDGSVDRISNLHGNKRRLLDNTPEAQNDISPNMSGAPQKKQNTDYIIPKDDDLLASILVGRTPALKIGPTPPLPKPSSKRPRLTQKVGLPKRRKVLLDETIVLHADAIRQQLINTEDIRRLRRKAPCTRPEIWRIQKSFIEEDSIFCESIFTGMSDELNGLPRRYDPVQNMHAQANLHHSSGEAIKEFEALHHSSGEAIKEFEVSKSSPTVRDNDGREIAVQSALVTERVDGDVQGTSGGELIYAESFQHAVSINAQKQLESPFEVPFDSKIEGNSNNGSADAEHNSLSKEFQISHEIAEVNGTALHTDDLVSFEEFTSVDCIAVNDGTSVQVEDLSNAKAASVTVEDMGVDIVNMNNLDRPQDERAGMTENNRDVASASQLDSFIVDVGAGFPEDSSTVIEHANISDLDLGLVCGDAVVDGEKASSEVPCGEMPNMVSFPVPPSTEGECVPPAVGENSCMNAEGGLDVESSPTRESSDFCSAIDDVDTDFLNVDDDAEYDEETINDAPHTEEAQSLENSGWSSRTRGVARYLKTMFDQDSGRARKSVAVDHLLAGKTRKEASRMFFETLVLKTRDYIHVEQDNPFGCINIKPRIKLLKTEF